MAKNKAQEYLVDAPEPDQESGSLALALPVDSEPELSTPAAKPRKHVVSVREWAADQAATVGMETASAFYRAYPHDYADPVDLAKAMDAYRNRVISD